VELNCRPRQDIPDGPILFALSCMVAYQQRVQRARSEMERAEICAGVWQEAHEAW